MNVLAQTEEQLKDAIRQAVVDAQLTTIENIPPIILEKPREKDHGDFATNIAMQLARVARQAPRQIAEQIVDHIDKQSSSIEKIEIAGPGFINFFMKSDYLGDLIPVIFKEGENYGKAAKNGERVQVEFVSVNPTGRLHLGHARGAAFGDVLCNVLAAAGYDVEREYYINDAGNQIDNLALSIDARYKEALGKEANMPEDGYYGPDIIEAAKELVAEDADKWLEASDDERLSHFKEYGLKKMLEYIANDLSMFRVHFDHWFSERSLYEGTQIADALAILKDKNYSYEQDGATWFRSTDFGDDKDRVLIKNDGSYTYLTPDIAYHRNKLERGFDK